MGAASRAKRDRIKLSEANFFRLKALIAQRALLALQVNAQIAEADGRINQAMITAGLTPGVQYEMDEKTLSAIPRKP